MSPTDKVSIDPEMLMTCLREAFGITQRIHNQYYNQVRQLIPNKDPSKVFLLKCIDTNCKGSSVAMQLLTELVVSSSSLTFTYSGATDELSGMLSIRSGR